MPSDLSRGKCSSNLVDMHFCAFPLGDNHQILLGKAVGWFPHVLLENSVYFEPSGEIVLVAIYFSHWLTCPFLKACFKLLGYTY